MALSTELAAQAKQLSERLIAFINQSPSPFHVVDTCVKRLEANGFVRLSERKSWEGAIDKNGKYFFTRNQSSIVAFAVGGKYESSNGLKIIGAHTDSPNLMVKPNSQTGRCGYQQISVATYGGGLWHTWFDRDLKIAGRVFVRKGEELKPHLIHINKPVVKVPNLCIHLQGADERAAFKPNKEDHICPILCTSVMATLQQTGRSSGEGRHHTALLEMISGQIGCSVTDIVDFELSLSDHQPGQLIGAFDEFISSPRIDNQASCFSALEALLATVASLPEDPQCRVVCLFDHEEIGSESTAGAASDHVNSLISRLTSSLLKSGGHKVGELEKVAARRSFFVSADMAHAVHPCYAGKHHELHRPEMHKGVVIKSNQNKRYATDGSTATAFEELARQANVPLQFFVVGNETPCGSTIGPILSTKTGIQAIDIGCGQLSMHSIRESCGTVDIVHYVQLMKAFLQDFHKIVISDDE